MPVLDTRRLIEDRVDAIRRLHDDIGSPRAQLDVSGGVDSAVLLGLLARAVGPEQITAVYSNIHSGDQFLERARLAAAAFGVPLVEIDLTDLFDRLTQMMLASLDAAGQDLSAIEARLRADSAILGSLRSCIRAPIGRGYNRMTGGGIRHGTGNECEDRFLRFYQKGGDGEVDTNPIGMLGKGEVFQLAVALGVPAPLIDAIPSPDLHGVGADHNDEKELRELSGVDWTYSRVDPGTGAYTQVGSIERMNRFLDTPAARPLFAPSPPDLEALASAAAPLFPHLAAPDVVALLRSCRSFEAATRHKENPNIPMLGTRRALVDVSVLTDTLPVP